MTAIQNQQTKNIQFSKSDIVGTWALEKFLIINPQGESKSWGDNCTGLLIYTNDNHMSVSINKNVDLKSPIEEKNFFDSILFYSGTFKIDSFDTNNEELVNNSFANTNIVIKHKVQQASNPNRIGKDLLRFVSYEKTTTKLNTNSSDNLTETRLTLSSPVESFGRGVIIWKKIN